MLCVVFAAAAVAGPAPCSDEHHRDFDFWLGTGWRVETADGQHAGDNVITREENGCLLIERWQGAQGGTGTSMNYYSRETGQWRQVWVSRV